MSKKFDPTKPHVHRCQNCGGEIPCRADPCSHAEWTNCSHCARGGTFSLEDSVAGTVVYQRRVPARWPNI